MPGNYVTNYNIFLCYLSSYNFGEVIIMKEPKEKLIITKKLKGEDGHKVFSVRLKDETVEKLDVLSKESNRTRNDLINMLLDYALVNYVVT